MRSIQILIATTLQLPATVGFPQESLCDPCVDGPEMLQQTRQSIRSPNVADAGVTVDEMRRLGVTSVADLIAQSEPTNLGDLSAYPAQYAAPLNASRKHIEELDYDPGEFHARVECADSVCYVKVYPQELDSYEVPSVRGCPLKYCATLTYSLEQGRIVRTSGWR
jgi:hypothetical protein